MFPSGIITTFALPACDYPLPSG